jgi:hypothetical protein
MAIREPVRNVNTTMAEEETMVLVVVDARFGNKHSVTIIGHPTC